MNETSREKMMKKVQMHGLMLKDIELYLDTHPNDKKALAYYDKCKKMLGESTDEYVKNYGPLTMTQVNSLNEWTWIKGPWPWENGMESEGMN